MKKNMFWLAAMAVTVSMASCSLNEVMEQPEPQAIGFSSFVGKPTKAVTQIIKGNLGSFYVYGGYSTTANVFNGTMVTSDDSGNTWKYTGTQYWVPGQNYKFAAIGPSGTDIDTKLSFDYTNGHLTLTDYEVTDLATSSKDLVYAEVSRTTNNPLQEGDYVAVPFSFGHIMSWIKIKFVHDLTDGYKITVSDVTVTGVKTKGTYNGIGWVMNGTTSNAIFNEQDPNENSYNQTDKILDAKGDNCLVDFIAIPQTVETLNISFKLTVQDAHGSYIVGEAGTPKEFSATALSNEKWLEDYVYTYTAKLDESVLGLKPITFTATVEGWTYNDDDNSLTIPNNP